MPLPYSPIHLTTDFLFAAAAAYSAMTVDGWSDDQPMALAKRLAAKHRKESKKKRKHGHGNQG